MVKTLMFRRAESTESTARYLVTYDFTGAQRRDKNGRYLDPTWNKLRNEFYEWLRKRHPGIMKRKTANREIPAITLAEAKEIYNKVIECRGNGRLFESNLLQDATLLESHEP